MTDIKDIFSDDNVARANAHVRRMQHRLDITNADHIALWLEEHLDDDTGIGWLACRIVDAHEAVAGHSLDRELIAYNIIQGSAGIRAAEHAKDFQTSNWNDALRSADAVISAIRTGGQS